MPQSAPPPLLVTQHYWPEVIGSGPYCDDLSEWLSQLRGRAIVFTCRPHYPDSQVPPAYRDGDRDRERRGRSDVVRVKPRMGKRRGAKERLFAELAFLVDGLVALLTGRIRQSDVVVSLCPSIFTVLLGVAAKRRNGVHVAVVHDIQSGLASGLGMVNGSFTVRALKWVERAILNRVDTVLVLSDDMRRCLREQGVRRPIDILPLWVDTDRPTSRPPNRNGDVSVVYSGNFGRKQGLDQIIDMAALLKRKGADISVVLRGEGAEGGALAQAVMDRGLDNVSFAPLVPPEELHESLSEADIHLVPQRPGVAEYAVPSKAFTVMAAERPFVATATPDSLLWRVMEESRGFVCTPTGDTKALADAVMRLARDPERRRELARNGRRYVVANHDKNMVREKFIGILRRRCGKKTVHERHDATSHRL